MPGIIGRAFGSWGPFLESPEDFSGAFRVTILFVSLNEGVSRHETWQLF